MRRSPRRVSPLEDLRDSLLDVEKPARYLGGEAGCVRKEGEGLLSIALCFPDLYEIGMSNNAIRILYSTLNAVEGLRAERVFAPAPDFEELLARRGLPLYTLETGMALSDVDILGFSLGFELAATSVLSVLSAGGVPLLAADRSESDPIVIAGGPAASNPHPLSRFLDAAYIGEAEGGFVSACADLARLKAAGAGRAELLDRLAREAAVWTPKGEGARPRARREVYAGFASRPASTALPIPSVRTVQDHGTVEIMRGCPNGCRFCHAGFFYRPQRMKSREVIGAEVEALVRQGGYREITLASLSSGDYRGIGGLLDSLNEEWGPRRVSFQLPSLKVNSFTLPILAKLAEVRKSGLTFAVETPVDAWQRILNKDVDFERTVAILEEARSVGFKQAKFYFMIGLPVPVEGMGSEAAAIVDFIDRLCSRVSIQLNLNVGTFVPKPHTPFQWCAQLGEDEALAAISELRSSLRRRKNVKVSYHSPFASLLEGVIARGDERVGDLILEAFRRGARLDAWEEHFDRERWRGVIESASWPVLSETCGARPLEGSLPWDDVSVRVSQSALRREYERAMRGEMTAMCAEGCVEPCGSCSDEASVTYGDSSDSAPPFSTTGSDPARGRPSAPERRPPVGRLVFQYAKEREASFLQHLSVVDALSRAALMCDIDVAYSEGFNPMPRLETTQPISIAVDSRAEIGSLLLCSAIDPSAFPDLVNGRLPEGLRILRAGYYPLKEGQKQRTIGSLEWGADYVVSTPGPTEDRTALERIESALRERRIPGGHARILDDRSIEIRIPLPDKRENGLLRILESCVERRPVQAAFSIAKVAALAKGFGSNEGRICGFFDAYGECAES